MTHHQDTPYVTMEYGVPNYYRFNFWEHALITVATGGTWLLWIGFLKITHRPRKKA